MLVFVSNLMKDENNCSWLMRKRNEKGAYVLIERRLVRLIDLEQFVNFSVTYLNV